MVEKKFIVLLQGKEFITHEGLLAEFHKNGGKKIETRLLNETSTLKTIIFKATAEGERGTFTGHGDADDENVNTIIRKHKVRMAETRAVNRALRLYNNIGMCSTDELGGDKTEEETVHTEDLANVPVPNKCECGADITEAEKKYSIKFYNRTLCRQCQSKAKK